MWWLIALMIMGAGAWFIVTNRREHPAWWAVGGFTVLVGLMIFIPLRPSLMEVQKIVANLCMPVGLLWVGLIILVWYGRHWPGIRWLIVALVLGYSVFGNGWVAHGLIHLLERDQRAIRTGDAGPFQIVAVLGGGTALMPDGRGGFGSAGDRVYLGYRLYAQGRTGRLVATGRSIDGVDHPRCLADETTDIWLGLGVPSDRIDLLASPRTTDEEIQALAILCREQGWTEIGIISSAWHLPRVGRGCRRHGLAAVLLPADFCGRPPPVTPLSLIPQGRYFDLSQRACWELLGMLMGR